MTVKKQLVVRWQLYKLKEHPRQRAMFGDIPDEELRALAENIKKKGLRTPIEILPDGTIICGHQRVKAAILLGWTEIDAIVRHDLAAAGSVAVEALFIEDNLDRRQLSPLARARCIHRMIELEEGKQADRLTKERIQELKERIAMRMGLSTRSVNRYLLIIKTPTTIQNAYDRGELSLTMAGKVALQRRSTQEQVAQCIAQGERATEVVRKAIIESNDTGSEVSRSFVRLVGHLRREMKYLRGHTQEFEPHRIKRESQVLQEASDLLSEFIRRGKRKAC